MKFLLVLVALVGLSVAAPNTRGLKEDLADFKKLIPIDDIRQLARDYLKKDPEFQAVVVYLQGPEWAQLMAEVASKPAVQKFFAYMLEAGIDLKALFDAIHDIIAGATPGRQMVAPRSLRSFMDEVAAMISKTEFIVLLNIKLNTSPDFQQFWGKVTSEESHQLVEEVRAIPEVQRLAARLMELGLHITEALNKIYQLLGWA